MQEISRQAAFAEEKEVMLILLMGSGATPQVAPTERRRISITAHMYMRSIEDMLCNYNLKYNMYYATHF